MKKTVLFFLICIFTGFSVFAQDVDEINPVTGFPEISEKPFVVFNEGLAASLVTRIQNQEDFNRSNFVWQDTLVGAYFEMQTVNMKPFNSILRLAAYYPLLHTFNGMEQKAKTVLLYGFDLYYGVLFQTDMWKYLRLNFALGPHFNYLLSDEYHHLEFGGGALIGAELPVHKNWTVLANFLGTVDYGNLGTNRLSCPYMVVWSYQVELGVRFSKKNENKYSYISSRPKSRMPILEESDVGEESEYESSEDVDDSEISRDFNF